MIASDQTALNQQGLLVALLAMFAVTVLLAAILSAPIYIWARKSRSSGRRMTIALVSSYLIMMVGLGAYAYVLVPAQYTHYLRMNWPMSSNSLLEITSVDEQRLGSPGAITTAAAAEELRESIDFARRQFFIRWALLTVALGVPVVLWRRGRPTGGRSMQNRESPESRSLIIGGQGVVGPRDDEMLIRA